MSTGKVPWTYTSLVEAASITGPSNSRNRAIATVTAFDPWFGFYPANVVTNQVIGSYGVYKGGVNGGAGIAFRLGSSRAKVFAEARYHHMFTQRIDSSFIPVTFGIRW